MTVHLHHQGQRHDLLDPQVYAGGQRRPVQMIYAYTGGQRRLVWARQLLDATAAATAWDTVRLTVVLPGVGADTMTITEGARTVYTGAPVTSIDDTLRLPSTAYSYTVTTSKAGVETGRAACSATTPARADMGLTVGTPTWDAVPLSWTDPSGGSVDSYKVFRGTTQVYSGSAKTFTDTVLMPGTTYSYTLRAYRAGVEIPTADTAGATTPAYPDLGLVVGTTTYSSIALSWSAKTGSVDSFELKRGSTVIYTGTGTTKTDTGLSASTAYSYTLTAKRGSTVIKTDTVSKTTPARPTSTGNVNGPAVGSGYYWTQSTAKTLTSTNVSLPQACYLNSFRVLISGYGATGAVNPHIDGAYFGNRTIAGTGTGSPGWTTIDGADRSLAAGAHTVGASTGGDSAYKTQWTPYSGGGSTTFPWDDVSYWYYSAVMADGTFEETHTESWVDDEGEVVYAQVFAKHSRRLLREHGDRALVPGTAKQPTATEDDNG